METESAAIEKEVIEEGECEVIYMKIYKDRLARELEDIAQVKKEERESDDTDEDDEVIEIDAVSVDSIDLLESDKIGKIWREMANVKKRESELYEELAAMAPEMSSRDLKESVELTPKPTSSLVPATAEECIERLNSVEKFKLCMALGELQLEKFDLNQKRRDNVTSVRELARLHDIPRKRIQEAIREYTYDRKPKLELESQVHRRRQTKAEKTAALQKSKEEYRRSHSAPPHT